VFERFSERAQHVVVLAQDEARALKHNYIGTEHILLGLLREQTGPAARVLESFGVTVEAVRHKIARIVGQGDEVTTGQIPFTPRTKKVLELALREALSLGHNYIGTEHILLGLVRENEGVAARILVDFGAGAEMIRDEVVRVLSGEVSSRRPSMQEPDEPTESFPPIPRGLELRPQSRPQLSRAISIGGRQPWLQPIAHHADLWFGMVIGTLLFGVGLLVGWLMWG
jgi:ATP-dependent Clp protease ATP-binding subunit ClpA